MLEQPKIAGRDLVLLLLALEDASRPNQGIGGLTRLQKLLFLLEKEAGLKVKDGFDFKPYKAGPYSSKLYDDLEFLENLGLIRSTVSGRATEQEAAEIDLSFEDLISPLNELERDPTQRLGTADDYEERRFSVTEKGRERIAALRQRGDLKETTEAIRKIKAKYGRYSLNELLYYVYTKYPDSATESEIRDKVLRRHH